MAHILLITLASALMIVAMTVDLVFGVIKAKQLGEATTSTGLKKTCEKARKYFSPFMVLVCIDLLSSVISPAPAFSLLWASYCIFCEFISVREKAWQKAEMRKQERTMSIILENKDCKDDCRTYQKASRWKCLTSMNSKSRLITSQPFQLFVFAQVCYTKLIK